jgi:uncharacterized protein YcnI
MTRKLLTLLGAAATVLLMAGPAFAHVTVNPGEVAQGSFTELTFRVPNERDDAGTSKVEVVFPTEHPIPEVSVRPLPGWTYQVQRQKLATPIKGDDGDITEVVSRVVWSGGLIKPGEYQDFDVSAGPMPEGVDAIEFKALQTYQNGEVVRWIQSTPAGGEEPENPAPTLQLTADGGDAHGGGTVEPTAAAEVTKSDVDSASRLGTLGLVLGIIGLVLGGAALLLVLRRPNDSSTS